MLTADERSPVADGLQASSTGISGMGWAQEGAGMGGLMARHAFEGSHLCLCVMTRIKETLSIVEPLADIRNCMRGPYSESADMLAPLMVEETPAEEGSCVAAASVPGLLGERLRRWPALHVTS